MGSLITAIASYLDIKASGGQWYVRIDNLDPPREDPSATAAILSSLHNHALEADLDVDYQSDHQQRYAQALQQLQSQLFYCTCSRKTLAKHERYPGTCRANTTPLDDAAIRLRVSDHTIRYTDAIVGEQIHQAEAFGDFVVKRRDGLWAYTFATAIDDGSDSTHVLRGQDLLHVTPQQIYVMQQLGLSIPTYAHIPLLRFADGAKLSKQSHAPALDDTRAAENVRTALRYLGLQPPRHENWQPAGLLEWALEEWPNHQLPQELATYAST